MRARGEARERKQKASKGFMEFAFHAFVLAEKI
jgi:hypothetical protein